MANAKFIPYAQQNINAQDLDAVSRALMQPIITRGPLVEEFEYEVATYCHARYAVAFSSGSVALLAAYYAADIGPSDRIITTPNSFIATINPGMQRGATPVFLDIDRNTGNLDLKCLADNINQPSLRGKTVIVPVHFAGIPVDMYAVSTMIANIRTVVIEDAAHAIGSRYKDGQMVGCCAWSDMTMFSFHPAKTITTGEGGMITTNDPELYRRLKLFRNNYIEREFQYFQNEPAPWAYEVVGLSSNYNFTEMQAALGLSQLKRIDHFIAKRQRLLQIYQEYLADAKYLKFFSYDYPQNVAPHLCVVQINYKAYNTTRTKIMEALKSRNIGTQVHYIPLYKHPVIAKYSGDLSSYFPEMEGYYQEALSLPLFYDLTEEDVSMIASSLNRYLCPEF